MVFALVVSKCHLSSTPPTTVHRLLHLPKSQTLAKFRLHQATQQKIMMMKWETVKTVKHQRRLRKQCTASFNISTPLKDHVAAHDRRIILLEAEIEIYVPHQHFVDVNPNIKVIYEKIRNIEATPKTTYREGHLRPCLSLRNRQNV